MWPHHYGRAIKQRLPAQNIRTSGFSHVLNTRAFQKTERLRISDFMRENPMRLHRLASNLTCAALAAIAVPCPARADATQSVAEQAAPAPLYDDPANWAAGPDGTKLASAMPEGATPAQGDAAVDVFYVHPTTFRGNGRWNQDPRDKQASQWTDESAIARQASAFGACCRIWAPRYRAAGFAALMDDAHRDPAFALAYSDVERAFDWFLVHVSRGRPFILAGHSQGAKHVADLLERRIDGTPLQGRMVAAYIVGINLAEGDFGKRFRHVPVCDKPAQTGCALQWNAVDPTADLEAMSAAYQKAFIAGNGVDAPGRQTLCINPVTFDRAKPDSISTQAQGAVPGDPGYGPMQALQRGAVAVRCSKGLAVSYLAPGLGLKALPGGSLHYHDIGLFWADLRANAVLRAKSWFDAHRSARRRSRGLEQFRP
jgi:hypothetical protein